MSVQKQIDEYIASQPEPKRGELLELHHIILGVKPACKLWFLNGKDDKGKVVSNPNIGYGSRPHKYADGTTREFYQIGLSGNKTGITALRIDAAKRLLLTQDDPVIDVATAVGFDSLSSFTRRFRATVGVPPAQLRQLADRVSGRPPRPFALLAPGHASVRVTIELPDGFSPRGDASLWVGWFPHPAPIGLPRSGALITGIPEVTLPLCPGAPHLLGFAVPALADALDQLVPSAPMVAVHPQPLTTAQDVLLCFGTATPRHPPLLTALPSLCHR